MATFHTLTIKNIIKETNDTVSIEFNVPSELSSAYLFKAGQYLTLKSTINGKEIRRSYSICSSEKSRQLVVAIKTVENGEFSNYANNELKVGDVIDVCTPEGKFILLEDDGVNYCAFAAGSGITPVLSMITSTLEKNDQNTFTLVYGNKTVFDTIFHQQLDDLKDTYSNRFHIFYSFSKENNDDALFGRIDASTVNFVLKNKMKNWSFNSFYLCGPEQMINVVSETLDNNNVPKERVFYELFTSSTNENNDVTSEKATIKVIVDDDEFVIDSKENKAILDSCLENDLDVPYSCQGGVCSSCVCRVVEGEVKMIKNNILTDSEVEEGLVLACQSLPQTKNVVVDFDDI